ncbi:MAG: class I SAM-dependent methyltransferase [Symploca sp. SIO1C4]|uniref:Class I SAM-dependent methyltransferase n=1 Tax=Symploca sp. SIO1C4 TaxID=2607765 RepID=A0A6B3N083_9CYAN|nr:class I SAM-dependent methyltransferase [Symploca sp. SIO1C4]
MNDKAGKKYWEYSWSSVQLPALIDPRVLNLNNFPNRRFHHYFSDVFSKIEANQMKLLEIGCARSAWLPYFAREFGFKVYGIDYSEVGCQQAKQVLFNAGVEGEIVCADFFYPPTTMLEEFDVVVSFGVAEHFEDTTACIKVFSKFLKPNGVIVTVIPNMVGVIGWNQKILDRQIFDIHLPLDSNGLAQAHNYSGLEVLDCNYFISTSFGICNLNGVRSGSLEWSIKKTVLALLSRFSMFIWFVEDNFFLLPTSSWYSPYINCTARKL